MRIKARETTESRETRANSTTYERKVSLTLKRSSRVIWDRMPKDQLKSSSIVNICLRRAESKVFNKWVEFIMRKISAYLSRHTCRDNNDLDTVQGIIKLVGGVASYLPQRLFLRFDIYIYHEHVPLLECQYGSHLLQRQVHREYHTS